MRILFAISSLDTGGAETHLVSLVRALAERGDRITVTSAGGRMVRELTERGIRHVTLPLDDRRPLSILRCTVGLRRLLREESFDLIHAHARIPAFLLSPLARRRGIPLVTTAHAKFKSTPLWRRLSVWGDRCISVSEDLRQHLAEEYGAVPSRVTVIPNGVDTRRFSPSAREGERENRFRLVFASRLDRDCSDLPFALCRLTPRLCRAIPDFSLLICGGGEAFSSLCAVAERINGELGRRVVEAVGRVGEMEEVYRGASAVCGVSRVALEAMACGIPVILGGNEGYFGILTPRDFARAEATNFCCREEAALSDERLFLHVLQMAGMGAERRASLGQALRSMVCERASLDRVAERTREVYAEAMAQRRAGRVEILLAGYYGFGNLGDDALLRAAIARARLAFPERAIGALTARGRRDESSFGVRCISRRRLFATLVALRRADVFVFGGGTLLQDRSSLRSLLYYATLLRLAAHWGADCRLWGNGLSRPEREISRRHMRRALLACSRIECRDRPSAELARQLLGAEEGGRVLLVRDLAEETSPCDGARREFRLRRLFGSEIPAYAVVAVRGKEGEGYRRLMCEWLSVLRGSGVELLFVPMLPREDGEVTEQWRKALSGRVLTGVDEHDLVSLMAGAEVVCGMRLHALVLAGAAGAPFVGFGGEEKIRCFCRERGGVYFTDLYR